MKLSAGFSVPLPSLLVYIFFAIGTTFQIFVTANEDLGSSYIFIVGLECVLTLGLGMSVFRESYSINEFFGLALVIAGISILRSASTSTV